MAAPASVAAREESVPEFTLRAAAAGVAIAFLVAARTRWPESAWSLVLGRLHFAERSFTYLSGIPAAVLGLVVLGLLAVLLFRAGRRATA